MKALTILQPFAELICCGAKRNETRHWQVSYRGTIAVHTGKKMYPDALALMMREPFAKHLPNDQLIPLGCFVAVAELYDIQTAEEYAAEVKLRLSHPAWDGQKRKLIRDELEIGDYSSGRFVWRLRNVRRLKAPVMASGMQGLWTPTKEQQQQIEQQL